MKKEKQWNQIRIWKMVC